MIENTEQKSRSIVALRKRTCKYILDKYTLVTMHIHLNRNIIQINTIFT